MIPLNIFDTTVCPNIFIHLNFVLGNQYGYVIQRVDPSTYEVSRFSPVSSKGAHSQSSHRNRQHIWCRTWDLNPLVVYSMSYVWESAPSNKTKISWDEPLISFEKRGVLQPKVLAISSFVNHPRFLRRDSFLFWEMTLVILEMNMSCIGNVMAHGAIYD